MLIGYETAKWQKIATKRKEAVKALSEESAVLVAQRLSQLAAFDNLGQIPFRSAPLHFHLLTQKRKGQKSRQGEFVIKLHGADGIVLRPSGRFENLDDGAPDVNTVTEVEIVFIGNYHGKQ